MHDDTSRVQYGSHSVKYRSTISTNVYTETQKLMASNITVPNR